ncbi:MAG: metal-dependent hydrolase [Proteobacteria bacterium]|nr:metal-dependent hydrolase [Pseudomonadota bacterium]
MPLPLGHTAVGLAIQDIHSKGNSTASLWKNFAFIIVLTNLPDMDVLIGLILHGNGNFFHRGPTHSFLFALVIALLVCNVWRCWSIIPKLSFLFCFLLLISHVVADAVLTSSAVSFWWPLELNLSTGYSGWREVIQSVLFGAFRDLGIIVVSGMIILLNRLVRHKSIPLIRTRLVKN